MQNRQWRPAVAARASLQPTVSSMASSSETRLCHRSPELWGGRVQRGPHCWLPALVGRQVFSPLPFAERVFGVFCNEHVALVMREQAPPLCVCQDISVRV